MARLTILVVEDDRDIRDSMKDFLELSGHDVLEAADGAHALEATAQKKPDVALIDIGLPGMDGYSVARSVRAQSEGGALKLIALTGYGREEDRKRALEAGFDEHLVKPVDLWTLDALLKRLPKRSN